MNAKQAKYPRLRFKGFTDPWEQRKLGDLAEIVRGASPRPIQNPKWFDDSSEIGWLRISDVTAQDGRIHRLGQHISVEGQEKTRVLTTPHLLLSIAATVGKPVINYISTGVHDGFLIFLKPRFELEFMFQWLENFRPSWQRYGQPGSQVNLNSGLVRKQTIYIPTREEQQKIAGFCEKLDNLISLHQRKLDLLKEQKKGYLQKMFPKNGAKVPELRFEGFSDDWEERKLSSGLREYTDRVIVEDDKEYYQISVRNNFGGITLRGSKMGNKIGRKRQAKINLTRYPQTLIFTRQTVEQGGIGWVDEYCDGAIVTENMPTISLDTSVFSKYFLTNLFQTRIFYKNAILDNIEGGSAQIAIHESKFLSSTLLFPNLDEQEKIGKFFKQFDNTIALHQRKLEKLQELKKGYLQKMFC